VYLFFFLETAETETLYRAKELSVGARAKLSRESASTTTYGGLAQIEDLRGSKRGRRRGVRFFGCADF
jgi:hypothetical protein